MSQEAERQKIIEGIRRAALEVPGVNGELEIKPIYNSKQFIYRVKSGKLDMKCRVLAWRNKEVDIHEHLQNEVDCVPRIIKVVKFEKPQAFKFVEWVEGKNLFELCGKNEFVFLDDDIIFKWGACVGKINNIKFGADHISIRDLWWYNFIVTPGGRMFFCDLSKVLLNLIPEMEVIRWIALNLTMKKKQKAIWFDGYYSKRTGIGPGLFDIELMLERANELARNSVQSV